MKEKKKVEKITGEEKGTEVFREEKQGRFIITTSEPKRARGSKKKSRILQTRDLPCELPGYHYPLPEKEKEEKS